MGPGQGGSRSSRVGRKEIIREVIGPGPGRVPGLFHQKRGKNNSYQTVRFLIFIIVGTPFHYVLLYTLYANIL